MLTLRRRRAGNGSQTEAAKFEFSGDDAVLFAEIDRLSSANGRRHSHERNSRLLHLRNIAGIRRLQASGECSPVAEPEFGALPDGELPEIAPAELTPGLLRAGILRDGCLLVRGLMAREDALRFAQGIERSFAERERHDGGRRYDPDYYEEFDFDPRMGEDPSRHWIKNGGGVLAVDAPRLCAEMLEVFRGTGVRSLVEGYFGEPPLMTAHKTTLRRAEPTVAGAWHQDGTFMGEVRALNLWLSLSRCGDEAPGLDIVPRRLGQHVTTQTDEAWLEHAVSQRVAEEVAGEKSIRRPIFEPGDALMFDELFLHKTGSDPSMPKPRFAIESWFFAPSGFPVDYAPLAI